MSPSSLRLACTNWASWDRLQPRRLGKIYLHTRKRPAAVVPEDRAMRAASGWSPLCSETHVFNCTCRCKPIRIRLYPEARHMTCISELPRRAWMYEAILSA